MNQVWLNGRLASDPESGESGSGVNYAKFAVAIERGSGESRETTFLDCVVFRQTAEFVSKYFGKGDAINVVGSISVRDWEDSNGIKRRKYEILVSQVSFPASGKSRGTSNSRQSGNGRRPAPAAATRGYDEPY